MTDGPTLAAVKQVLLLEPNVTLFRNESSEIEGQNTPYLFW